MILCAQGTFDLGLFPSSSRPTVVKNGIKHTKHIGEAVFAIGNEIPSLCIRGPSLMSPLAISTRPVQRGAKSR